MPDPPPLNLAGVPNVDDDHPLIDPSLTVHASDFFAAAAGQEHHHHHKFEDDLTAVAAAAVAAAAQHHQQQQQQQQQQHHHHHHHEQQHVQHHTHHPHDESTLDAALVHSLHVGNVGNMGLDVGMHQQHGVSGPLVTDPSHVNIPVGAESQVAPPPPPQLPVMEGISAAHLAPFSRPHRGDGTPHPEILAFANRAEFEVWFEGESSWCHFVQRRTTTPEKRADERLRARIKAHERMLASMTPEEAASAPPLKRRRRTRTSSIREKVTFTCHHAGRYEAKHSTTLPREKLRLNTKKSVKCDCPARIVLTEMEDGDCKVSYYWRHDGHDAYADDELESGRLPKVIDEWLVAQIQAGKDTDEIRRSLMMTDEEKQAYLTEIAEDPTRIDPDKPPPLALTLRIKYPDIYNRFRKLRGPIKEFKPPKNPRGRKRALVEIKEEGSAAAAASHVAPLPAADVVHAAAAAAAAAAAGVPPQLSMEHQHPPELAPYPPVDVGVDHQGHQPMVEGFTLGEMDPGSMPPEFALGHELNANELGTQEGLARVLLALPRGHGEAEADDAALSEAVLRMASESEMKDREWAGVELPHV